MSNKIFDIVQSQIGHSFKNPDLLQQAFVRRSYSKENGGENNEVLEFIGDKVLDFVIVKLLAEKYGAYSRDYDPNADYNEFVSEFNEGKLTEIKKKLVCQKMLARRVRMFGFQYELIMGQSDIDNDVEENESVQEDLFEAIIGAVALDSNWNLDTLSSVIDTMLDPNFYLDNGFDNDLNYVELLQQWYQKKHRCIPVYEYRYTPLRYYSGQQGTYVCRVSLFPYRGFEGVANTKSEARMAAAEEAYRYFEENGMLFDLTDEVGEPNIDRAINQLQELYQKGYIGEPNYKFSESYDQDGNPIWRCECHVAGKDEYYWIESSSKKQGKKHVAYDMLCEILEWEAEDENQT